MFKQGVSKKTSRDLALLGKAKFPWQFYLAGGTAAALRLGHRLSFDLDFFTRKSFPQVELEKLLKKVGKFKRERIVTDTLLGVFNDTKVSFFRYDYPLIGKTEDFQNIQIASLADLSAMKIDAISRRGTKRDFIDLFFICQKITLLKAFADYRKKYGHKNINFVHAVKSLNYFEDAKDETMPEMLVSCDWKKVKDFFLKETPKILKESL